jgi:hypothetical protein
MTQEAIMAESKRIVMSISEFLERVQSDHLINRRRQSRLLKVSRYSLRRLAAGRVKTSLAFPTLYRLITAYGGKIQLEFSDGLLYEAKARRTKTQRLPSEDVGNGLTL